MTSRRLTLIAALFGLSALLPTPDVHAAARPCAPRSSILNTHDGWIVGSITTQDGRIKEFEVLGAYPPGRFEKRAKQAFEGRACEFDSAGGDHTVVITSQKRFSLARTAKEDVDGLVEAVTINDRPKAAAHLKALHAKYEAGRLNLMEAGLFHALAAPVYRAARDYANARRSALVASHLNAYLSPGLIRQSEFEIILADLGAGAMQKALKRFESLQKNAKEPLPAPWVSLMELARTDPQRAFSFDDMNLDRAIANALKPATDAKEVA